MRLLLEGTAISLVCAIFLYRSSLVDDFLFYAVYDLLANRRTVKIQAHANDVNSCCWADTASGNVLVSASDDTFLKVWCVTHDSSLVAYLTLLPGIADRLALHRSHLACWWDTPRESPMSQLRETVGISFQMAKTKRCAFGTCARCVAVRSLRSLRMISMGHLDSIIGMHALPSISSAHSPQLRKRYGHYPRPKRAAHPEDCSVMTYRGHAVLRTLIRCHFSPMETTGGQYIYSGSSDGRIHVWNCSLSCMRTPSTNPGKPDMVTGWANSAGPRPLANTSDVF